MSPNISTLDKAKCTGCSLCYNVCPKGAISLKTDDEGFTVPVVGRGCVDCGKCSDVCPAVTREPLVKDTMRSIAVRCDDDIRSRCSSGGVFGALAEDFLKKGGVVYGAAFDVSQKTLSFARATDLPELAPILKSKYVQCEVGDTYRRVKDDLEKGLKVLFCGCPCQTDALLKYLGKGYDGLVALDILCHGAPSPLVYGRFLEDVSKGRTVRKVDFRDKKYGWGTLISVEFDDGSVHYDHYNGDYFKSFLNGFSMRKACYTCQYSQTKRVGDLTLGDFWGVGEIDKALDDRKGTSLVLCNTDRGRKALESVRGRCDTFEEIPLERTVELSKRTNGAIFRPTWEPRMRGCFFRHIMKGESVSTSLRYAETSRMDIGLLGWWIETPSSNYGSTLTNYALYSYLMSQGYSVAFVSPPYFDRANAGEFNKRYAYRMTAKYDYGNLKENNRYIDTFIVGSDVLWYYDAFIATNHFFMLDFVSDDRRKISYSTSFGNTRGFFPEEEIPKVDALLKRFDSVAVRESEAVDICRTRFGVDATLVLDPVFICDRSAWDRLACNAGRKTYGDFLFGYILDPDEAKVAHLKDLSEKTGMKVVTVTDRQFDHSRKVEMLGGCGVIGDASVEEVVYHLMHAKHVITDSYHGLCFSLVFGRDF
ncbi:MAG: Coenzyme F420 hydrogenase/dehydrogenase, beta subunit C-terminal domain, partial [archaeon]|nr:Coenzyme F420 hydrogenase/dehydrogenase, beta subunit C-terminal domain [archaeon]